MIINDYLKENNISKYQLSKMTGLPYGTLNDIIIGKTDVMKCSGATLLKIAKTLKCTVDDLLNESLNSSTLDIEKIKRLITPIAKKYKLHSVYIFGSYARSEATEESDIDILIDRENSLIHGMLGIGALNEEFKNALGKDIDIITLQSLKQESTKKYSPDFIENVMRERVKIYD